MWGDLPEVERPLLRCTWAPQPNDLAKLDPPTCTVPQFDDVLGQRIEDVHA